MNYLMKTSILLLLVLVFTQLFSQSQYSITFFDQQLIKNPDSVQIINTSYNQAEIMIGGIDTLILKTETNIEDYNRNITGLAIYPNPTNQFVNFIFNNPIDDYVNIALVDIFGKTVLSRNYYLKTGGYKFKLDGLGQGCYIIHIQSENINYAQKIVSEQKSNSKPIINLTEQREFINQPNVLKSATDNFEFIYNDGDLLKITAFLGLKQHTLENVLINTDTILFFDFIPDTANNAYPSRLCKLDSLELAALSLATPYPIDEYGLFNSDNYYIYGNTSLSEIEALNIASNTLVQNSLFSNVFTSICLDLDYAFLYSNMYWKIGFQNQIYSGLEVRNSRIAMIVEDSVLDVDGHHFKDIFIPSTDLVPVEEIRESLVGKVLEYYGLFEIEEFVITEEAILENFDKVIQWHEKDNFKEFRVTRKIPIAMNDYVNKDYCDFYVFIDVLTGELLDYYPTFICK
ncbi:MAG: T9SS type A sorting domain-containing protein [Salinivirgaceae bacterium]|nr:T9SS type A sorting domain-containing protein [Salinivirgaceae bacterium]